LSTAVQISANWYPDPSGRAEARYWDGRMWTAHVVRDGVPGLDELDGVQQPSAPSAFTSGGTPVHEAPVLGPGTRALQEMAAARPTRRRRSIPITSEPRINTRGAIGVFLFALLLFIIGLLLYREGALTVDTPPANLRTSQAFEQPEYHVTLPNDWAQNAEARGAFDAAYAVPDKQTVSVGVVDFSDTSLADPSARDAHVAMASDMVAGSIGDHPTLVSRSTVRVGDKTLVVATYDVTGAFGTVTRVAEYVAVGPDRAVIVVAYGTPAAVARHLEAAAGAAASARIK
jgi:hypothetical protein